MPLLGTHGGISYNPILARRQFGYPMKGKPSNHSLYNEFYLNPDDSLGKRAQFVQAWHTIHKKDNNQLGRNSYVIHESYTQWVIDRAIKCGMPYHLPRFLSSITPAPPLPLTFNTKEEYQKRLAELNREKDTWKRKYQEAELQIETMSG